jgi:hypothetical protein
MLKRKRSEECGCCSTAKRPAPERKQQLYLLLDDWERGYSVRRLDVDAGGNTELPPKQFTEPPLARIEAPHVRSWNQGFFYRPVSGNRRPAVAVYRPV